MTSLSISRPAVQDPLALTPNRNSNRSLDFYSTQFRRPRAISLLGLSSPTTIYGSTTSEQAQTGRPVEVCLQKLFETSTPYPRKTCKEGSARSKSAQILMPIIPASRSPLGTIFNSTIVEGERKLARMLLRLQRLPSNSAQTFQSSDRHTAYAI